MYYFIVNPNSRSGRGRSIWNEIHQQLMLRGIDFQYCLTRYSGHAAEIASDACALGTESEPVYILSLIHIQQKEANEPVNNTFAQALSGIKL